MSSRYCRASEKALLLLTLLTGDHGSWRASRNVGTLLGLARDAQGSSH